MGLSGLETLMRLLLLSNSSRPGEGYLEWPRPHLSSFLGTARRRVLFVPYAGLRMTPAAYTATVRTVFEQLGHTIVGAAEQPDPLRALEQCDAVAVGGGNTFHLLARLYATGLLDAIRERVRSGTPYIGWSAGANVACPTIRTTNDMPIVEPPSFDALGLVPFQINAHFTDAAVPGHGGETRRQRIEEFLLANPGSQVVALPEGTGIEVSSAGATIFGVAPALVFRAGAGPAEVAPGRTLLDSPP
jgi:dipeptidase E